MAAANQFPVGGLMFMLDCSLSRMTFFVKSASVSQLLLALFWIIVWIHWQWVRLLLSLCTSTSDVPLFLPWSRQTSPESNVSLQNMRALAPLPLPTIVYLQPAKYNAHLSHSFAALLKTFVLFLPRPLWRRVFMQYGVPFRLIHVSTFKSKGNDSSGLKKKQP